MSINKSINKGLIAVPWKFLSLFRFTSWIKWAPCNLHSKAVNPIWHGVIGKVILFPFGLFDGDFHLNVPKIFLLKAERLVKKSLGAQNDVNFSFFQNPCQIGWSEYYVATKVISVTRLVKTWFFDAKA